MNIPGFTADLSLNKINNHYKAVALSTITRAGILPAQFGEMPAPDGPDFPGGIPGLSDIPQVPLHKFCFYPCQRICFPLWGGGRTICFYPCQQRCFWV